MLAHVGGPHKAENCVLKDSLRREITYFRTNSDRTQATSVLKTVAISTQETWVTHCFRCQQVLAHVGGPHIAENCVLKDSLRREITYFCTNSDRTLATSVLKTDGISTQKTWITHCFRCLQVFAHVGGPHIAENCVLKDSLRRKINYFRTNSDRTLATSVLTTVAM